MPTKTITAPDGKRYKVTAPEGTSDATILKRIQAHHAKQSELPENKGGALNYAHDMMRQFNQGLIGPWTDELDGVGRVIDNGVSALTKGTKFTPGAAFDEGQRISAVRDKKFTAKNPNTAALASGTGMAASLLLPEAKLMQGATMAPRAINNAVTGLGYGTIMGAGKGDGGAERTENALTGGAISGTFGAAMAPAAALGMTAYRRGAPLIAALSGPKAINRAGVTAGRRKIGEILAEHGTHPSQIADDVAERAAINVPASPSDVSEPLRQLTGTTAKGIGPGQSLVRDAVRRKQENSAARMRQHVDDTLGSTVNPHAQSEVLTEQARKAAKPLYDAAYEKPLVLNEALQEFTQSPAGRSAMATGRTQIENTPSRLRNVGSENPTRPGTVWDPELNAYTNGDVPVLEAFDGAKQHLDDMVFQNESPFLPMASGTSGDTRPIRLARGELLRNLDDQIPEYAAARAAYAGPTMEKKAFETGLEDIPGSARSTVDDATAQMADMTPSQLAQFRLGDRTRLGYQLAGSKKSVGPYADASAPIMGNDGKRALIEAVHGPEAAEKLYPKAAAEREGHLTYKQVFGGSNTSRDLADMGDDGPEALLHAGSLIAGGRPGLGVATLADRLKSVVTLGATKAKQGEMGRILTEEDPAAVRQAMADVQSGLDLDDANDQRVSKALTEASKLFAIQGVGRSGDETGLYGPTE